MRVNVYAEEMTDRVEIVPKEIEGHQFTGLRFYLALPVTTGFNGRGQPMNTQGPFMHREGDDDSSAVTFWGKRDLRGVLRKAMGLLDAHYEARAANADEQQRPPAIGAEWRGGVYAGRSLADDEPVDLVLLPGDFKGDWKDATAWASKQDGTLPSRIDLLVLWQNLREQFKREWHWSSETSAGDDEYAWSQDFGTGYQGSYHKDDELRARAVRRIPIE